MKRYPIGIQTFETIRERDYLYVDKTDYVYNLAHSFKFVFLSRPRRFGKSLLTTTFKSYFEGRKDLFEGLKAGELEIDWTKYPVLHFDMSTAKHVEEEQLKSELNFKLLQYEKIYGRDEGEVDLNQRLQGLIKRAVAQTGQKVAILIDEYDAPLLDVLTDDDRLAKLRQIMRNFYSPLKACDADLRFVFLTGITKFSQLSIFSELNNLENISMNPRFTALCGISENEMLTSLDEEIGEWAKVQEVSKEQAIAMLKANYDGYHFSKSMEDVYNPFSLLQALKNQDLGAYWFSSGTPTFLLEQMKRFGVKPEDVKRQEAWSSSFDAPTEGMTSILPLLYQSGYLTIKGYNRNIDRYVLDIPNGEVHLGIMNSMLPYVMSNRDVIPAQNMVTDMYVALCKDDFATVMEKLKTFLGTIPYTDNTNYEGHYQSMLFVIFSLMCKYVDVEVHTPQGRCDIVLESPNKLYIIELKLNGSVKAAEEQINLKDYDERFALSEKPVVNVAVNFSAETRNIADWKIV